MSDPVMEQAWMKDQAAIRLIDETLPKLRELADILHGRRSCVWNVVAQLEEYKAFRVRAWD